MRAEFAVKRAEAMQAKYDATDGTQLRKRRRPTVEVGNEESILTDRDRLTGVARARDLQRNYTSAKSLLRQFELHVVGGVGPKAQFHTANDEWNKAASSYFNSVWAKAPDGRDDTPLNELVLNSLTSVKRDGDCLWVFDDFLRDDGKVLTWEADQMPAINPTSWKTAASAKGKPFPWKQPDPKDARKRVPMLQSNGVVYDAQGRVVAYVTSAQHGEQLIKYDRATIFPRAVARLLKRPWRLNQRRGASEMLAMSNDLQDVFEMRSAELQSGKRTAQIAGIVKKRDAMDELLLKSQYDPEDAIDVASTDGAGPDGTTKTNYERLEAYTGGLFEYMEPEDDLQLFPNDRPSPKVSDFGQYVLTAAGASMGLGQVHSTLSANKAYTAFRGEMLLSWAAFSFDQKFLERRLLDWLAARAVAWAIRAKTLAPGPVGWDASVSWTWPGMPEVDELKSANAVRAKLKNGELTYLKLLGPDWPEKLAQLAKELNVIRKLELPLSIFETVAGAEVTGDEDEGNQDAENE